jgi:hypothetical protein
VSGSLVSVLRIKKLSNSKRNLNDTTEKMVEKRKKRTICTYFNLK